MVGVLTSEKVEKLNNSEIIRWSLSMHWNSWNKLNSNYFNWSFYHELFSSRGNLNSWRSSAKSDNLKLPRWKRSLWVWWRFGRISYHCKTWMSRRIIEYLKEMVIALTFCRLEITSWGKFANDLQLSLLISSIFSKTSREFWSDHRVWIN